MKFKMTAVSLALFIANSVVAQNAAYYSIEEITVNADGANYGAFPVAMSEDSTLIATYSMKAALSANVDIGLPFTFNRECQYDRIICDLEFYGSEDTAHKSFENAYQKWRNAQAEAKDGNYTSYMMGNVLTDCPAVKVPYSASIPSLQCSDNAQTPFDTGAGNTDVKITGVYQGETENFVIGYSSAPYDGINREFVRRAFIKPVNGEAIQLMPKFTGNGGFSSAYNIKKVGEKVLVVGHSSVSYPKGGNVEYFNDCYNSDQDDDRYNLNELTHCPGFDTQAWIWDVTDVVKSGAVNSELSGSALATDWIDGRTTPGGNTTFSAHAADINADGLAVGASTFEFRNNVDGARQRAIIMKPVNGGYEASEEISAATQDIEDQKDWVYNTWAVTVSNDGIITGNRELETAKGRNKATEFFVYNNDTKAIQFPLLNKKVATAQQRADNGGSHFIGKSGANSRVFDANENGLIVGEVDDYDQVNPVYDGSPRAQMAFLYDNRVDSETKNQAWLINDLICSQDAASKVTSPLIRIRTARVINEDGVVLADGYKYENADDYKYKNKGTLTAFKLTPNPAVASPNLSPNCWESDLLKVVEEPYERQGAATGWLWIFALPLLFIRRFKR